MFWKDVEPLPIEPIPDEDPLPTPSKPKSPENPITEDLPKYNPRPKNAIERDQTRDPRVRYFSGKEPITDNLTVHSVLSRRVSLSDKFAKDFAHLKPKKGRKEVTFAEKAWYLFHPFEFEMAKEDKIKMAEQRLLLNCFDDRLEALQHRRTRHMYEPRIPCTPLKVILLAQWAKIKLKFKRKKYHKKGAAGARMDVWNLAHPNSWDDGEYVDEFDHTFDWYF